MFNKPTSGDTGLMNKSSYLAPPQGVTELLTDISICLVTLCCIFELTYMFVFCETNILISKIVIDHFFGFL